MNPFLKKANNCENIENVVKLNTVRVIMARFIISEVYRQLSSNILDSYTRKDEAKRLVFGQLKHNFQQTVRKC